MTDPCSREGGDTPAGPLAGVKVIDLTSVMMGPYATMILGDYGADIIKVESPEGDVMRHAAPMRHPQMGAMYLQGNRNKRSIVLDLKKPGGRDALLRLAATADVFVHNVRPAAMRRLKLGADDLLALNPRLVYASLHGFGEQGPYAGRPAYDDLIQGMTALPALTGQITGEPRYSPADDGRPHRRAQRHACDPGRAVASRPQRRRPVDRDPDVRNHGAVRARRPHVRPEFRAAGRAARLFAVAVAGPPPLPDQRRLCLRAGLQRQAMGRVLSRDRPATTRPTATPA